MCFASLIIAAPWKSVSQHYITSAIDGMRGKNGLSEALNEFDCSLQKSTISDALGLCLLVKSPCYHL